MKTFAHPHEYLRRLARPRRTARLDDELEHDSVQSKAVLSTAILSVLLVAGCTAPHDAVALTVQSLDAASCSEIVPCAPDLVCVDAAAGPNANRCERPHAFYSFLELDTTPDGLQRAVQQVLGQWLTERELLPLVSRRYPMTLASGETVRCHERDGDAGDDCWIPDWSRYIPVGTLSTKYDSFALFGMRPLRFLVSGWRNATDAQITAAARSVGSSLSAAALRTNFRNTLLAAIDGFVNDTHFPLALAEDPSPGDGVGWLNPNAAFDAGLALWDPTANDNCRIARTGVAVPHLGLYYYDLRASIWDRHASAFRAMTLVNAYFQLRGLLSAEQRVRWLRALRETGDALALSSSFEPGQNHGISEAAALLQLGTDFEQQTPALVPDSTTLEAAWRELALSRLNDVIGDTMLDDGAQNEQSLFYHNYELGFLIEAREYLRQHPELDLGRQSANTYDRAVCRDGSVFDDNVRPDPNLSLSEIVEAAVSVSVHTSMPSGEVPMLGSSPSSSLALQFDTAFDRYVAASSNPSAPALEFARSVGVRGAPPPASERMRIFADSGYVTMRSAFTPWPGAQTHILFNTEPPRSEHAHLDALSVHLYGPNPLTSAGGDGLPLLVDSGWYSYSSPERHYFESTQAHNTVSVDGLNQCSWAVDNKRLDPADSAPTLTPCGSLPPAPERAGGWPAGTSLRGASLRDEAGMTRVLYQSAEAGLYSGISHRRGVALFGREIVLVLDQLQSSNGARSFVQNWHLSPTVANVVAQSGPAGHYRFTDASNGVLFSAHFPEAQGSQFSRRLGACRTCSGDLCAGAGCTEPEQGWYSTAENSMVASWVLERAQTAATVTWASVFLLGSLARTTPEVSLRSDGSALDSHHVQLRLPDGLVVQLDSKHFGAPDEAVTFSYLAGSAMASYSFEGEPSAARDLAEGLGVSVSVPGETTGDVRAVPGVVGAAYRYTTGRSVLASPRSFGFLHRPRAAFTIAFWLRMDGDTSGSNGGTQAIFSTGSWSSAGTGVQLYFQDDATRDNALRLVIRGNGGTPLSVGVNGMVPEDGNWHYFAVSFDSSLSGDQTRFYRDGVVVGRGGVAGALSSADADVAPVIGQRPGSSGGYALNATLDEFVVFKRALGGSDVAALYNGGNGMRLH